MASSSAHRDGMPAVVRRGEESSSDDDDDDDAVDAVASSPERAPAASPTTRSARSNATNDGDADYDARSNAARVVERRRAVVARDARDDDGGGARARAGADGRREGAPNTKFVAACVAPTRDGPIARAAVAAKARDRDLGILSQTSASMTRVNAHAREAALAAREAADTMRRLTRRHGRDDDDDDEA